MPNRLITTTLAGLILMQKGELSIDDIRALPLIEEDDEVLAIVSALLQNFDCELQQRRIKSSVIPSWEEVLSLKPKPKLAATS